MAKAGIRKRLVLTVVITVLVTALLGLLAMNFSPPEKKLEQTLLHRYSISDPQFRREMGVMLGPAIVPGNRVTSLQNGDQIFSAMLEAISSAKHSITFETYIYWSGAIGKEFADALSERAQAGVAVNIIVDWVGSIKMEEGLLQRMQRAGVRIHRYRPLRWYALNRLNYRTHRKLLVVDGRVGFTGGVGIADQWLGNAQDSEHWRDSHFRIEGPAVAQMQAAFNDNWVKTTGEVLNGEGYFPPLAPNGNTDAHLFIASPSGGSESMHLMYMLAVSAAKHSIDLAASYFVPDELIAKALVAARQRGVRIRILLPGPFIDADAVRLASKAGWGLLLQAGIEIHEYQPTMLHMKLLVADREFVSVGSTNFDIRSFRLNDEASLNLYDRAFAEEMTKVFESDLARSKRYAYEIWERRPLTEKLIEKFVLPLKSQL
jgi:cardiolipin synthase A/B